MMDRHELVLASTSPWRRALLEELGIPCRSEDPGDVEAEVRHPDPAQLAALRAQAKALAVAARLPKEAGMNRVIIGADQVAHMDGQPFGKPVDAADWRARLRSLRGRSHQLTTGVCLASPGGSTPIDCFTVTTYVRFRAELSDAELDAYVALGEAAGCAGGYMVERRGAWLIEEIRGDWQNVIGLPILPLVTRLRGLGFGLPASVAQMGGG